MRNTEYLQIVSSVPSIRQLVYAVRYWAKMRDVAGNIHTGPRLSNYALQLLVITFLMHENGPKLLESLEQQSSKNGVFSK